MIELSFSFMDRLYMGLNSSNLVIPISDIISVELRTKRFNDLFSLRIGTGIPGFWTFGIVYPLTNPCLKELHYYKNPVGALVLELQNGSKYSKIVIQPNENDGNALFWKSLIETEIGKND